MDLTESDSGLLTLTDRLGELYGGGARLIFLIGFLAVTSTSLLGVWNGVSLLFTDWTRSIRLPHGKRADIGVNADAPNAVVAGEREPDGPGRPGAYEARVAERSWPFRGYLLWLTFPPMALLLFDKPFALTLVYGVLGSFFMPFLAITLLLLLNTRMVAPQGRSGWLSNGVLGLSSVLFVVLLVTDLQSRLF
jgi:hypothetical protein